MDEACGTESRFPAGFRPMRMCRWFPLRELPAGMGVYVCSLGEGAALPSSSSRALTISTGHLEDFFGGIIRFLPEKYSRIRCIQRFLVRQWIRYCQFTKAFSTNLLLFLRRFTRILLSTLVLLSVVFSLSLLRARFQEWTWIIRSFGTCVSVYSATLGPQWYMPCVSDGVGLVADAPVVQFVFHAWCVHLARVGRFSTTGSSMVSGYRNRQVCRLLASSCSWTLTCRFRLQR